MKYTVRIVSLPPEAEPEQSSTLMEFTDVASAHLPNLGDFISLYDFDVDDTRLWVVVSRLFRYFSQTACFVEVVVDATPDG